MFDAAYKDERLHVCWTETVGGFSEAYYSQYSLEYTNWIFHREEITEDYVGEKGGRPRVAVIPNRLIFSYNTPQNSNMGYVKTRYRELNGLTWSSSVAAFVGNSVGEEISSDNTYAHLFYCVYQGPGSNFPLYHTKVVLNNTNWGTPTQLADNIDNWSGVKCSKTYDGLFNIAYICFQFGVPSSININHRIFSNNAWASPYLVSGSMGLTQAFGFSTVSNDLYFGWFYNIQNSILHYRQYDALPLAPQNLAVTQSGANHPMLNWAANKEPDIWKYKIEKKVTAELGWQFLAWATTNSYEDVTENYVSGPQIAFEHWVWYRVRAVDKEDLAKNDYSLTSAPSNEVATRVKGAGLDKTSSAIPTEYALDQNYPNPFNPTTKISWQSPISSWQTIKVYDVLGNVVAVLFDEFREAGRYEIEFNAHKLPTGMYFYKLETGKFTSVKKMLLVR